MPSASGGFGTPEVSALGANCGVGPGDAVAAAHAINEVAPDAVTITKANCGIPLYKAEGGLTYPLRPDDMGDYVELALRSGARIIGACCGSTPDHIAAIREAVDAFRAVPGPRSKRSRPGSTPRFLVRPGAPGEPAPLITFEE